MRIRPLVSLGSLAVWVISSAILCAQMPPRFNRDVRPILSDKCFQCHGPDARHREADLRLDVEAVAKESAIVAGDPDKSELIQRITSDDKELRMPPADSGKELTAEEIETLRQWVASGAQYERHWAYAAPKRQPLPEVAVKDWSDHPVDRFILAKLEAAGLEPVGSAAPRTLVRRLHFDLIGLPPQPEVVDAFVANPTSEAYEKLIDSLLASERFGERMAVYWLDLVRYADTVGYHGDQDHAISPYRDYVIDAFNRNLPFDQFTREQLAGDLLPDPTTDQKVATGYNRLLQTSHEGGVQPKEYLAIYAADRIRNFSNVWLGATMGCCQCHDHKYDPYTAKDFYSMQAFFADIDEAQHFKLGSNALPTRRPPEIKVLARSERNEAESLEKRIAALEANQRSESDEERNRLEAELKKLRDSTRLTMITVAIEPREIRILPRGNWLDDSGPLVQPAIPEFLGELGDGSRRSTRLDLANWLVDAESGVGGLTARVMANRLWYLLFGRGLSASLDDFGGQGEPPSHPDLLDHLALSLLEGGWDVKAAIKSLVMTRAYRLSSAPSDSLRDRDPLNKLYGRQARFRLPAEFVRDSALSVSGLLVNRLGGLPSRPYQPAGYYRHLNFPTRKYVPDATDQQWRRGVYMHWQRQFLHPTLRALDAPSREECTARRPISNTPLAAMALLNDPSFVEAAKFLAARALVGESSDDEAQVARAVRLVLAREPDSFEQETLLEVLAEARDYYQKNENAAADLMGVGIGKPDLEKIKAKLLRHRPDQDVSVELAAWTSVARVILNLSETITRN